MHPSVVDKLEALAGRGEELSGLLADPAVIADQARFRSLAKELSDLQPVSECYRRYRDAAAAVESAHEMLEDPDPEIRGLARDELGEAESARDAVERELRTLLVCDLSYSTLFQVSQETNKALLMLDLLGNIGLTRANLRDPVGLLGYSDRIELYLRPKLGTSQVFHMAYRIFEKLKLEREFPRRRPADLRVAVDFMLARLKMRHSIILLTDLVDLVNDPDAVDFKQLGTLAAKHDMIVLVLDDPDEFRVRSRLGYIRISDMETGKQTVMSARKAGAVRRRIEETRAALQYRLKHQAGIDSTVLTERNHLVELPKFLMSRFAR